MQPLARYARLALDCVHREYPNQIAHRLADDSDARPPRQLTPAFYGCYDWHSAVHGHWLLARAARLGRDEDAAVRDEALARLSRSLSAEHVRGEVAYLAPRPSFERPYGLAWLLTLHGELSLGPPALRALARALAPLVEIAWGHLSTWLPKLATPVRSGVHSQTAFALALALDWARATGRRDDAEALEAHARRLHEADRELPLHLEPSGEDFLSPSLGAADLMRRVLDPPDWRGWLARALPGLGASVTLSPAAPADRSDGRLTHLDGLNLSRAWTLRAIAEALGEEDPRAAALHASAERHARAGLSAIDDADTGYAGSHWLGTFAAYWLAGPL